MMAVQQRGGYAACLLLLAFSPRSASSHGSVVRPRPRQAIDGHLPPWSHGFDHPDPLARSACPISNRTSTGNTGLSGALGQSCFFFSSGCSIGCPSCDGISRGPIPEKPCDNASASAAADCCAEMNPPALPATCRRKMDTCGLNATATVCRADHRTVNTAASCGGPGDWFYYSPWRGRCLHALHPVSRLLAAPSFLLLLIPLRPFPTLLFFLLVAPLSIYLRRSFRYLLAHTLFCTAVQRQGVHRCSTAVGWQGVPTLAVLMGSGTSGPNTPSKATAAQLCPEQSATLRSQSQLTTRKRGCGQQASPWKCLLPSS